jgi:hypothetical protein
LAKGKDAALSGLAKNELAPPTEAGQQVKLADGWFERAEKEQYNYLKVPMQERAAVWYGNALPALAGLTKVKVEGRLKGLPRVGNGNLTETGHSALPTLDLLSLIDLSVDTATREWRIENNALIAPKSPGAVMMCPYVPPEEYSINFQFERTSGDGCLVLGLVVKGNTFALLFDAYGKYTGLESIDQKSIADSTEAKHNGRVVNDGKPHRAEVFVRKNVFKVNFDDVTIVEWKPDYSRLSKTGHWPVTSMKQLFVASWDTSWRVTKLQVTPLKDAGTVVHTVKK